MLQNLPYVRILCMLWLTASCATQQPQTAPPLRENYPVTESVAVDSASNLVALIQEYRKELDATMRVVVGHSAMYMPKGKPESLLSNLVADFTYELGKNYCAQNNLPYTVEASIVNTGGLRKAMPQGAITLGDVYEISPFENKLLIVALYGKDLRKLFDHITRIGGEGIGNVQLKASKETQKLQEALIGGHPLQDEKLYHIISIDYLINGGDGMVAFGQRVATTDINLKSRDALLEYVKQENKANRPLQSALDNRISYE